MNKVRKPSTEGIGRFDVMGFILITLKLVEKIDWNWWLVFTPFLISALETIILHMVYYYLTKENK